MVRMIAVMCCVAVVGVGARASAQAPVARLTLAEALALADTANPTVRAKEFEVQAVGANEITAALRPNPTLSMAAEQYTPGGTQAGGSATSIAQYTFSIGQPIELGGKRQRRVDSAKAATKVTGYELADLKRQLVFQVKKSFSDVLVARDALALTEENLSALDELERVQRLRAEKGDISGLDLLRIEVERFTFERDKADARQALSAAKIALRTAIGQERLAEQFEVEGQLTVPEISRSRTQLYRMALDARPDLRAAEAAREKARADINLAKANAWWDLTPQIEYQRIGPDNTIGVGLSLPIKLFDRNQGEIARTQAEAKRADASRQALLDQALAEVDTALAVVTAERSKVSLLRDTYLPKIKQARDTVEFAYKRGGMSLLDFLDAQRTYREKSLDYLRSLSSYHTAVYQLEAAVGGEIEK